MKKKVSAYIRQQGLFTSEDKLLVALSGGADSVALLRLLIETGYPCEAAHCNFHLRGEESDRDEQFVRRLCQELKVPLHVTHFQTQQEARQRKISIEMAARELRYEWFEKMRQECGAAYIAVAHHQDDSLETFLLNLLRGTGINGLRGIRPKNGYVVRPLLCLSRQEIMTYVDSIQQEYVTDSTNLQDEYTRNKIRLHLIPLMEEITPAARTCLQKTARHLDEAAAIYNKGVEEALKRIKCKEGICIDTLLKEEAPCTLLFEALSPFGFNESQVKDIYHSLQGTSGKSFKSDKWHVVKDRNRLLIEEITSPCEPQLLIERYENNDSFVIPRNKETACLDADKLKGALSLRLWREGDSFVPFGMKGRKLISDYLTNRKFSLLQKEKQWVLCSGDEICWLVGERSDNRFRVDESTRNILLIRQIPHL